MCDVEGGENAVRAVKHRWIQINNDNLSSHFSDLTNMEESSLVSCSFG